VGWDQKAEEIIQTLEEAEGPDSAVGCFRNQKEVSIAALKAVRQHALGRHEDALTHLSPVAHRMREV